jgi:hypothetical protein
MKKSLFTLFMLLIVLASLWIPVVAFADSTVDTKRAPSNIKLISNKAKELSGYYSTAKTALEVAGALGEALGVIKPHDANAQFNALHDHLNTVATGINWQATKNFIDAQRGPAIWAITNLKRDKTAMRGSNEDQDSGSAAETLSLGGGAFNRPYNKKDTDGWWRGSITYTKEELLPQPGDLVYDWRLGIPALLEVISYRLQFIAAIDPNFRNNDSYDEELERYRSTLERHLKNMLAGIKCARNYISGYPIPPLWQVCADIRTGIEAIEWWPRIGQPMPDPQAIHDKLRSEIMRAMPIFEVRAMIDTLYLYQYPWLDLTEKYQRIPVYRAPHLCLDVQGGSASLWDCDESDVQQWVYDRKSGTISNPPSGRCLDVQGGSAVSGTPVQLWLCNGGDGQKWTYDPQTHVL